MENWIYRRIKNTAIARGIAWSLTLACILFLFYLQSDYVYNFFFGPFPTSSKQIESIGYLGDLRRDFVTISAAEVVDTGLREVKTQSVLGIKISKSEAHFYVAQQGNRYLIIKSESLPGSQISGGLHSTRLGSEGDLQERIGKAEKDRFYPFYLNTDSYRTGGYVTGVALLIFVIFFWRSMSHIWLYMRHPQSHPVAQRLASWGDADDIARQIQKAAKTPTLKSKGWKISENFAIQSSIFQFNAFRLTELIWAYKQVTRHSTNFIPTGKTYALIMHWQDESANIEGKEAVVDKILQFSAQAAPWAIFGHSKELEDAFGKHKDELCAAVAQRKQEVGASS